MTIDHTFLVFPVTGQGRILGAAEPVKLDLDLEDIPDPGSDAAVEETKLLLEASVIEFCETQWDLLPSSCTVCRLVSRTVESAMLPELIRMLKAKAAAGSDVL